MKKAMFWELESPPQSKDETQTLLLNLNTSVRTTGTSLGSVLLSTGSFVLSASSSNMQR